MIHIIDADKKCFEKAIEKKRVICFGLGKHLERFIELNPEVEIMGIADNYKHRDMQYLKVNKQNIPIWSSEELEKHIDKDSVVVITSLRLQEIADQLDAMESMDGKLCFIEASIDGYKEIDIEQQIQLREQIKRLESRTEESVLRENYGLRNRREHQKRYQIWEYIKKNDTAGSKAREDVRDIAGSIGYQVLKVHCSVGQKGSSLGICSDQLIRDEWLHHFNFMEESSFLLIQGPIGTRLPKGLILQKKKEKNIHIIYVVHDVELLRKIGYDGIRDEEFETINEISDRLIVHNESMKKFYVDCGVKEEKLISLQVFDYLSTAGLAGKSFDKSVVIAGNLSLEKSPYLRWVRELDPIKVHLYGVNFSEEIAQNAGNIIYHGSVPSDIIPEKFSKGFGLVWDGDRIDTCSGNTGTYLRYNNPHKLSLYLSAGLPVIIWDGAAEKPFVMENQVGFAVHSLYEIEEKLNSLTEKEYFYFVKHAEHMAKKLKAGEYTRQALKTAEESL